MYNWAFLTQNLVEEYLRFFRQSDSSLETSWKINDLTTLKKNMRKIELNPLELDKETIARLDEAQLNQIVGGQNDDADETNCQGVGNSCVVTSCNQPPVTGRP